jgi:tRNA pseudouridine55 synthase
VDEVTIRITATVSKGTYIRTLAEDIGAALGCGAHLTSLRRVATGGFDVARCVTLEAFEAMDEAQRLACLLPVESLVTGHQRVVLDEQDAGRFLSGVRRRGHWMDAQEVAVFALSPGLPSAHNVAHPLRHSREGGNPGGLTPKAGSDVTPLDSRLRGNDERNTADRKEPLVFLGTAHIQSGELIPSRLLNPIEIQQILSHRAFP